MRTPTLTHNELWALQLLHLSAAEGEEARDVPKRSRQDFRDVPLPGCSHGPGGAATILWAGSGAAFRPKIGGITLLCGSGNFLLCVALPQNHSAKKSTALDYTKGG